MPTGFMQSPSFTGGTASGGTAGGSSGWGGGNDWSVNLAGSGQALQAGGAQLLWIAVAVGVVWWLTQK